MAGFGLPGGTEPADTGDRILNRPDSCFDSLATQTGYKAGELKSIIWLKLMFCEFLVDQLITDSLKSV